MKDINEILESKSFLNLVKNMSHLEWVANDMDDMGGTSGLVDFMRVQNKFIDDFLLHLLGMKTRAQIVEIGLDPKEIFNENCGSDWARSPVFPCQFVEYAYGYIEGVEENIIYAIEQSKSTREDWVLGRCDPELMEKPEWKFLRDNITHKIKTKKLLLTRPSRAKLYCEYCSSSPRLIWYKDTRGWKNQVKRWHICPECGLTRSTNVMP